MVTQANVSSSRDSYQRNDCDINKQANKRNWNNQQRDQVVVVGKHSCAASLVS